MAQLLAAAPGFETFTRQAGLEGLAEEGSYLGAGVLAEYIASLLTLGEGEEELRAIADLLEEFLGEGSSAIKDLIVVGLFEGLMSFAFDAGVDHSHVEARLGPEGAAIWRTMLNE